MLPAEGVVHISGSEVVIVFFPAVAWTVGTRLKPTILTRLNRRKIREVTIVGIFGGSGDKGHVGILAFPFVIIETDFCEGNVRIRRIAPVVAVIATKRDLEPGVGAAGAIHTQSTARDYEIARKLLIGGEAPGSCALLDDGHHTLSVNNAAKHALAACSVAGKDNRSASRGRGMRACPVKRSRVICRANDTDASEADLARRTHHRGRTHVLQRRAGRWIHS